MKCRACGQKVILFSDGFIPRILNLPKYGRTEYHLCDEAKGETARMLPLTVCKDFSIDPEPAIHNDKPTEIKTTCSKDKCPTCEDNELCNSGDYS